MDRESLLSSCEISFHCKGCEKDFTLNIRSLSLHQALYDFVQTPYLHHCGENKIGVSECLSGRYVREKSELDS